MLPPGSSTSTTGLSDVLRFDAGTHEYTVNGALVPSVTQILKAEGFTPNYGGNNSAAARGTWVHWATTAIDAWQDTGPMPKDCQGYINAYLSFIADNMPQWVTTEERKYSEQWGFAGTSDRTQVNQVWDIKTGAPRAADQLQLAGYAMLWDDTKMERWNLYLHATGNYEQVQRTDKQDFVIFTNAVCNYSWKRKRGIK